MRLPQVLVYEGDGRVAELLRETVQAQGWPLRELRRPGAGVPLLNRGGPSVLVLRIGRDVEQEMRLLHKAAWLLTACTTIVICDSDNRVLASLAWDLGASCVLSTAQAHDHLAEVVIGLMHATNNQVGSPAAQQTTEPKC